jgi:hypothetical protein
VQQNNEFVLISASAGRVKKYSKKMSSAECLVLPPMSRQEIKKGGLKERRMIWKRFEGPAREAFTLLYEYRSGPFAKNRPNKKTTPAGTTSRPADATKWTPSQETARTRNRYTNCRWNSKLSIC